jgi:hypothetical protein
MRDLNLRSRRLFAFHKPEILLAWLKQDGTLRARLRTNQYFTLNSDFRATVSTPFPGHRI